MEIDFQVKSFHLMQINGFKNIISPIDDFNKNTCIELTIKEVTGQIH